MLDFRQSTALFGGSFDPVHSGHLHVAREVLRLRPEIKQFLFVPAHISPGKPEPSASAAQRLHFLELSLQGTPFQVWSYELQRPGASYTASTLEEAHKLGAKKENLYWAMGADAYRDFETWHRKDRIRELTQLIVVERPGSPLRPHDPQDILLPITVHAMSSTLVRDALKRGEIIKNAFPPPLERHLNELILKSQNPYAMH